MSKEMSNKRHPLLYDKAWLEKKYLEEGLNTAEIGMIVGRCPNNVSYALKRLGIPKRSRTEATIKYPKLWDKEWLKRKYLDEWLSGREIAEEIGCNPASVNDALKRYEIPRRTPGEGHIKSKKLMDKEWLEERYIEERLSATEIGNILGCCNTAVLGALERFEIPRRNQVEAHAKYEKVLDKESLESLYIIQKKSAREVGECLDCSTSSVFGALNRYGLPIRPLSEAIKRDSKYAELNDKEWLYQKYWIEKLSSSEVAGIVGCDQMSVRNYLAKHGIRCRTLSESQRGEMNGFYGKTHTEESRKMIRENHADLRGEKSPLYGKCGPLSSHYGSHISEEHKQILSNRMKGNTNWLGRKHSEETKALMRENRKKLKPPMCRTSIEVKLERIFNKYTESIEYTGDSTFWIHTPEININPDFIVKDKKIAIEANGDYWHSPLLNPKIDKISVVSYRRELLKREGWKLIVFWETDINRDDAEKYVEHILKRERIICATST
ncbi:MAG: NUMOD3 domain-containing DNA-binding protein [Euryarchaeota archaeon]|nr:NUMOD3 domain-containing DNA-binding protein [Euryarchaeota archaeon]